MSSKILLRRGTAAQWSSANPILGIGELGIETDTLKIKIGNGTSTWTQLTSYANVTPSQLTSEINNLISAAPATLDTLNELAAAINNDASFSTTVNNLLTGKVSKSGGDTITASTASTKGLIIKAAASQSVNLLEFQNSIGNPITYFNSNGGLTATEGVISTLYSGGYLTTGTLGYYNATTFAPSVIPIVVRGAASQTANLQEWQNSASTANAFIDKDGQIRGLNMGIGGTSVNIAYVRISNNASDTSSVALVIRGVNSQTGNLQQWQNSAGTVLAKVDTSGNVFTPKLSLLGTNPSIEDSSGAAPYVVFRSTCIEVNTRATTKIGLIVQGVASQTADLQQWQNSSGTVLSKVLASGQFVAVGDNLNNFQSIGASSTLYNGFSVTTNTNAASYVMGTAGASETTFGVANSFYIYDGIAGAMRFKIMPTGLVGINSFSPAAQLQVNSSSASTAALIVKGTASQTANLQEWQDSTGTVLAKVDSAGTIIVGASRVELKGNNTASYFADGISSDGNYAGGGTVRGTTGGIFGGATQLSSAGLTVYATAAGNPGAIIRGAASQSANLQEWQNSSGSTISYINPYGTISTFAGIYSAASFGLGTSVGNYSAMLSLNTTSASYKGAVIRGAASQTANLQEWQNSSGSTLAYVNAQGYANFAGLDALGLSSIGTPISATASLLIDTNTTTRSGIIIKGVASQTADLQQWQNSAGTVLARVDAYGHLKTDGYVQVGLNNGLVVGGVFVIRVNYSANNSINIGDNVAQQSAAQLQVTNSAAGKVGFIVKAAASQSANLTEWQNSAGTTVAFMRGDGLLNSYWGYHTYIQPQSGVGSFMHLTNNGIRIEGYTDVTNTIFSVKSMSGQTGNLQEWQNSGGTVLAKITASGALDVTAITVNGAAITSTPTTSDVELMNIMGAY